LFLSILSWRLDRHVLSRTLYLMVILLTFKYCLFSRLLPFLLLFPPLQSWWDLSFKSFSIKQKFNVLCFKNDYQLFWPFV
jgi:hypothetical protein